MFVYLVLLFFLVFLSLKYDFKGSQASSSQYQKWSVFILLLLICIAGFRNQIGIDTYTYEMQYDETPTLDILFTKRFELISIGGQSLWVLLFSLFKTFHANFFVLQLFIAVVFNLLLFRYLKHSTDKFFVSLFCIVVIAWWNLCFEVLRESLCVGFFLNGILSLSKGDKKGYLIWCIPAWFIHFFSIFVTLFVFVAVIQSYRAIIWESILFSVLIVFVGRDYVAQELLALSAAATDTMADRMIEYAGIVNNSNLNGIVYDLVIRTMAPLITSYYLFKKDARSIPARVLFLYLPFTALMLCVPIFYRLSNYLIIIYVISAISYLLGKNSVKKPVYFLVLGLFIFTLFDSAITFYRPSPIETRSNVKYDCRYIPYTSIFEPTDPIRDELYNSYSNR